jgi:hypothetical protein
VTVDNSGEDQRSIIRISGEDKPFLLQHLTVAVEEAGFVPTRINVPEFVTDQPVMSEFFLGNSIHEADVVALRAKVESVWADAPGHAPVAEGDSGEVKAVPYEYVEYDKIPEEVVEKGMFFNVDPYAHADWTTLTAICAVQKGVAQKMMTVFDEDNLNIIFASIRSVDASDSGVATDVYLLQTLSGKPLGERERVSLHNKLVRVVCSD